jgi:hypothetical protein
MIRILLAAFAIVIFNTAYAQKWERETICSSDTLRVEPHIPMKHALKNQDSTWLVPYRIVKCITRSNIGLRLDAGVSGYTYGAMTSDWIGNHAGPNFGLALAIDKLNIGFRFKPWTVDLKKEMEFDGVTLPTVARLNAIKLDYYTGYSFDFERLISIEPYLGYNRSSFIVINEDELNQEYSFRKTGGFIFGTTLNKYFKVGEYQYVSVYGSAGYSLVNYEKIHPGLDNGYFEWTLGVASKGFFTKFINRKVR